MSHANLNILDYTHIADYLNAVLDSKAKEGSTSSIRSWAKELGLESASLLTAVLRKERRLSEFLMMRLIGHLKFTPSEQRYFEALAVFSGPRSPLDEPTVIDYLGYLRGKCQETQTEADSLED